MRVAVLTFARSAEHRRQHDGKGLRVRRAVKVFSFAFLPVTDDCISVPVALTDKAYLRLLKTCVSLREYRKAHHHLLSLYAEHELEHALNETCEALVRAMHLSILVQENPLANTTGHQGLHRTR